MEVLNITFYKECGNEGISAVKRKFFSRRKKKGKL